MAPAKRSKLIYVDDDLPGISRRRAGRGWAYHDAKGNRITARDEIDRLNAVPPLPGRATSTLRWWPRSTGRSNGARG